MKSYHDQKREGKEKDRTPRTEATKRTEKKG